MRSSIAVRTALIAMIAAVGLTAANQRAFAESDVTYVITDDESEVTVNNTYINQTNNFYAAPSRHRPYYVETDESYYHRRTVKHY